MRTNLRTLLPARAIFVALSLLIASSLAFAKLPVDSRAYLYKTKQGDTLIGLGGRLLKQPEDWVQIQKLNKVKEPTRIPVGTGLLIPISMLRMGDAPFEVIAVEGVATFAGQPLKAGMSLPAGSTIETSENGFVTIRLAEGTEVQLQSGTKVQVATSQRGSDVGVFDMLVKLVFGRVETKAATKQIGDRLEISTPTATMGVRGTVFRVATLGEAATSEVLEGLVSAQSLTEQEQVAVKGGFGTKVEPGKAPSQPIKLLDAPSVDGLSQLHERTVVRFNVKPVVGAIQYRAQVATDRAFKQIIAEGIFKTTEVKFSNLSDGEYYLKLRAIDASGLEGNDAVHTFKLKARPEPPLAIAPNAGGKLSTSQALLAWTESVDASHYRVQVAPDATFSKLLVDQSSLSTNKLDINNLPVGQYFWRLASNKLQGSVVNSGPWGEATSFSIRPVPQMEPPKVDGKSLQVTLAGEAGQSFDVQVATDPDFRKIVSTQRTQTSPAAVTAPGIGVYYLRYRTVDPDGFASPYSGAQRIEVFGQPWWLLMLTIPFVG